MDLRSPHRTQVPPRSNTASAAQQTSAPQRTRQRRFSSKKVIATVVAALVVLGVLTAYLLYANGPASVKSDQYQAVFLTNGQVYFGKITSYGRDMVTIKDIYYLQQPVNVQDQEKKDQPQQNQLTLTKLGNELHGPEDAMFIERSQILFWENVKNNSRIVQAIDEEKKSAKP